MHEISNHNVENTLISELFRYRTEYGELQCHRLNVAGGTGLGSRLLSFAEKTACALGFRSVELRPFSTDPMVPDTKLREWYIKRGYRPDGGKMCKRINNENFEVTS